MSQGPHIPRFPGVALPLGRAPVWPEGATPTVVWACPARGVEVAGFGVAAERCGQIAWRGAPPPELPGPWFGGWAFDAQRPWAGFPTERWILPAELRWRVGEVTWSATFGTAEEAAEEAPGGRETFSPSPRNDGERVGARGLLHQPPEEGRGDVDSWTALVSRALQAIGRGQFEKLVVARTLDVTTRAGERAILDALRAHYPACQTFLLRGTDGGAFVGASPETLCEVRGDRLRTEALAGTAAPGQGGALLRSDKDLREHAAVVCGVREALLPFVAELDVPAGPSLKELANVVHLHTPITARLVPGVDALEVARALHPTPAVAGWPRPGAVDWLRRHEAFARGWYAGVVGARGPGGAHLVVGLRAAHLRGEQARLFVGAGIVAGSTAEGEWQETERKAWPLLGALRPPPRNRGLHPLPVVEAGEEAHSGRETLSPSPRNDGERVGVRGLLHQRLVAGRGREGLPNAVGSFNGLDRGEGEGAAGAAATRRLAPDAQHPTAPAGLQDDPSGQSRPQPLTLALTSSEGGEEGAPASSARTEGTGPAQPERSRAPLLHPRREP